MFYKAIHVYLTYNYHDKIVIKQEIILTCAFYTVVHVYPAYNYSR